MYKLNGKIVAYNRHKATDQKEDSLEEFMADYALTHSEKECNKLMHELEIIPARKTYTYRKESLVAPICPGDIVKYEKVNKIKGNTKTMIFPAVSVRYSEVLRSKNGQKWTEREWKIGVDDNRVRKAKFCKPLQSGCLQTIESENTNEYLAKVLVAEIKRKTA